MHIMYFTERAYTDVPEEEILKRQSFFGVPNKYFDPVKGAKLLNEYLDDKVLAEEVGFDGVMLNEHHGTPFCMGAVMDMEAAVLARITKKVKIVLLGNPLPVNANPLRLAEELAMIDMISGGRLVPGWVRGAGSEQFFANANPAYNREYFNEAHDLIIAAWTKPGPFRWEGKHFHFRFVNPWVFPLQKPHPPIWIPGLVSPETVVWCAKHRYPYLALATFLEPTIELWNIYANAAAQEGYQAGPENFGYLQKIFLAETDEKAQELGKADLYGGGITHFARPEWMFPSGYNSKEATKRLAHMFVDPKTGASVIKLEAEEEVDVTALKKSFFDGYQGAQNNLQLIRGTPKTVIPKLKKILDVLRPGIFAFWNNDGPISTEARRTSIRLLGQEVIPALREHAKTLGLNDPFEVKPGSRKLSSTGKPDPVANREALAALGA
jgi:alkanesulfonate monooxygenase SsuD/methylene tetrahydromethanopterin reductase-like flavin-dependent oxidoreductase (luciferase family)